jgi:hypothetical protein
MPRMRDSAGSDALAVDQTPLVRGVITDTVLSRELAT